MRLPTLRDHVVAAVVLEDEGIREVIRLDECGSKKSPLVQL